MVLSIFTSPRQPGPTIDTYVVSKWSSAVEQVYGAVTMNNTMCLGLFLLVMHIQRLPWTYSSEVLVTVGESPLLTHPH